MFRGSGGLSLSVVADRAGEIVAQVEFSPLEVEGANEVLVLAPMAVLPDCRRHGLGTRIARHALDLLGKDKASACVGLGHPSCSPRFGFVPAKGFGLKSPHAAPEEAFLALELREGSLAGEGASCGIMRPSRPPEREFAMKRLAVAALVFVAGSFLSSPLSAQCAVTGPGCPGFITPSIQCVGSPVVCSPLPVLFGISMSGGASLQPAVLVLGVDAPPSPLPSFPLCLSGCSISMTPLVFVAEATGNTGHAQVDFAIPCDLTLVGQSVEAQWATLDPSGIILCAVTTPEMRVTLQ